MPAKTKKSEKVKHQPCQCELCVLSRNIDAIKASGTRKQLCALIDELADLWLNVADDLNWHQAILDGSWPSAVEILERALVKAKERAAEVAKRKVDKR